MLKQKAATLDLKSVSEKGQIEGYLNTFNHIDRVGDNTQKGAFTKSIKALKEKGEVLPMLFGHDHTKIIGVWTEIKEDEHGLYGKGQLNLDTELGREVYSNIKIGAVKGISIGYFEKETEWDNKTGSLLLKELELIEASIVLLPCNSQSNVEAVKQANAEGEKPKKTQLEKALREMGFSRRESKTIIAEGCKSLYEDGTIESIRDIYDYIFWEVENMPVSDVVALIDKLNEFIKERSDEESEETKDEMVEDTKDNEDEVSKDFEQVNTKLDELLNLLTKGK